MSFRKLMLLSFALVLPISGAFAADEIPLRQALVLQAGRMRARSALRRDLIEAQIVSGQWQAPVTGVTVPGSEETNRWETIEPGPEGSIDAARVRGGYVWWPVVAEASRVMILEAAGHSMVYVNDEIRAGDAYGCGYMKLPVLLQSGTNEFLFQASRGAFRAKLTTPKADLVLSADDATLPDVIAGELGPLWGAVLARNATTNWTRVSLRTRGSQAGTTQVAIPPLGVVKAPFVYYPSTVAEPGSTKVLIESEPGAAKGELEVSLNVRRADQGHKRTFLSTIDGSVQYYAVQPATSVEPRTAGLALFLSLHGASVEATGQAGSYSQKSWGNIVCPTNRRPYGFDWEEWGRWDTLEVLAQAQARYNPDPARVYLTGHSMGGHGTWHLGVHYPDKFAAIGPSAGWISFMSYASGPQARGETNEVLRMLRRAAAASDTLLLATNLLQEGVYILHGDADDNVPVSEAREMRKHLEGFHHDFEWHEEPGAGHWWDASDEPGTDCVDWAPMFDFFARHAIPSDASVRRVRFVTVNPAVSDRLHWVLIAQQEHSLLPSGVDIRCDPGKRRFVGTSTNVARLWLGLPLISPGSPLSLELDGERIENAPWPQASASGGSTWLPAGPGLWLVREQGHWRSDAAPPTATKNPGRGGPFREAFKNQMILVYGTQGTSAENAWAFAKARFDSESFWYRGNASLKLVSDLEYQASHRTNRPAARNVILYGHSECNSAWPELLKSSAVQVKRGSVKMGTRELKGENLGCLFLQPNPAAPGALVGVVAGTGLPGLRLTDRMNYFQSGAGFPDCLVASTEMLRSGISGVRAVGFFGQDWQVETGDFVWQE
jgi:pimeloyl-ACP methyl ester carboxylesterase